MFKYTNRYGDVYTFTKQEDGSVLWEGDFKYCRFIYSDTKAIDMIDPSGGPYLSTHTNLYELLGEEEVKGLCISSFEPIETGYKLHTKNK